MFGGVLDKRGFRGWLALLLLGDVLGVMVKF